MLTLLYILECFKIKRFFKKIKSQLAFLTGAWLYVFVLLLLLGLGLKAFEPQHLMEGLLYHHQLA